MNSKFPTYGIPKNQIFTFVKIRGHILPVSASDDQYRVCFPDGTRLWIEKWDCQSPFNIPLERDIEGKRDAKKRADDRNSPSSSIDIDLAFERNANLFKD